MGSNGNQVPMGESFQFPVPPAPVKEKARIEASTGYGALDETPEVRINKLLRISRVHHRKTQSVRIASAITSAQRQWWVRVVLKNTHKLILHAHVISSMWSLQVRRPPRVKKWKRVSWPGWYQSKNSSSFFNSVLLNSSNALKQKKELQRFYKVGETPTITSHGATRREIAS